MLSCSHWGIHGGPIAEPMVSHGEPVYGGLLWWAVDDKTGADCQQRFENSINFRWGNVECFPPHSSNNLRTV